MTFQGGGDGRDARFETIYRNYYGRVYRFYRLAGVPDDEASDLCQEAFKRLYENFDHYRGEAVWSYIETIARNVLYNVVRARGAIKRTAELVPIDDPDFAHDPPAPEAPDYAQRQHDEIRTARLRTAIDRLPRGQRECLLLYLDDFTYDEMARALRISIDAVKARLRDARKILRAQLGTGEIPEEDS